MLSDEVVLRAPAGVAGGIINDREADGQWDGVSPEICGYYLQFLALAATGPGSARHRETAARVIGFLDAEGKAGAPRTLYRRLPGLSRSGSRSTCASISGGGGARHGDPRPRHVVRPRRSVLLVSKTAQEGFTAVYRFYGPSHGSHFCTASEAEKTFVQTRPANRYNLDGIAHHVPTGDGLDRMFA
ncbi:hypothetical protein ACFQY5_16875 [Paeniroseomonas aquatica]|uniref:DUF5648 domain-containing protein n=1 Tax=Paeniroseomonas aquatica TaxID=373043 RepID=A0ABT8ABC9_9PROT|nr:hypothetical protein [Paeniroseomonas aquatica]MDN3567127.1 hypothetical protein [Paeniroseomonas aquatica]